MEHTNNINQLELSAEAHEILKQLDTKSRMVMILKYIEEFNYEEIAEIMNIPVGTLKSIAARAISKIKVQEAGNEQ